MLLPYERAISDFLLRGLLKAHPVLPTWLWHRLMLWLPEGLGFVFDSVRFVVGFIALTPLVLWPPAWPMLARAFERARCEAERRRRWRDGD
jgi:hypothetical protein